MSKVCIVSSFSNAEAISNYVKEYLIKLSPFFDRFILATNERRIPESDLKFLSHRQINLEYVKNSGHDFGMYYQVLKKTQMSNISELCLVNDSCIPLGNFDSYFNWFRKSDFDYAGLTDCYETCYYIQSYFLTAKGFAVKLLIDYILTQGIKDRFSGVVKTFERGTSEYLVSKNCKIASFFSSLDYSGKYIELDNAEELIKDGFPLIKKKLLTKKLRHFQRYRLEKLGYNLDYNYRKVLKGKTSNLEWLLDEIHGNEELTKSPKVSIIIDSNRSSELKLTDHYSYKNFDILTVDRLSSENSPDQINSEYFLFLENNSELLPNSIYRFLSTALNTNSDLIYSNEMILKSGNVVKLFEKPKPDSLTSNDYVGESFFVTNTLLQKVFARTMSEFKVKLKASAKRKFHIADYLIKTSNAVHYTAFSTEHPTQRAPFGWSNIYSAPAGSEDLLSAGIENLRCKLSSFNNPKIALFGAGQHTERLLNSKELPDIKIAAIFDDSPTVKSISGIDVIHSSEINTDLINLIVLSSDTIEDILLDQLLKKPLKNVTLMTIYSDTVLSL